MDSNLIPFKSLSYNLFLRDKELLRVSVNYTAILNRISLPCN